jgi:ankyrin repeat protein
MDDSALLSYLRQIADDDASTAGATLRTSPELATACLERGATRQQATDYFLTALGHHVYAGDTALHIAAAAYRASLVEALVGAGASVDAENRRHARPLHYAVDGGPNSPRWDPTAQRDTVASLLRLGADPDAADANGTPPLLRAVRNRCTSAVEALLEGGADPTITNSSGSSARDLASMTTGRSGSGSAEAKAEQAKIIRLLAAAAKS